MYLEKCIGPRTHTIAFKGFNITVLCCLSFSEFRATLSLNKNIYMTGKEGRPCRFKLPQCIIKRGFHLVNMGLQEEKKKRFLDLCFCQRGGNWYWIYPPAWNKQKNSDKICETEPGMVAHAYNSSTVGGQGRRIAWAQEFDSSLSNIGNPVSTKNTKISQVWWCIPVVPATQDTEAGESLELGRWRLQWVKIMPLYSSPINRVRLCLKKERKMKGGSLER